MYSRGIFKVDASIKGIIRRIRNGSVRVIPCVLSKPYESFGRTGIPLFQSAAKVSFFNNLLINNFTNHLKYENVLSFSKNNEIYFEQ